MEANWSGSTTRSEGRVILIILAALGSYVWPDNELVKVAIAALLGVNHRY